MKIRNVTARIKGQNIDQEIEQSMALIIGENEAGKSAIIDAVTLSLRGYHPSVMPSAANNNNRNLLDLNNGKDTFAKVTFEDGSEAWVRATKDFDDKVEVKRQSPSSEIYSEALGSTMLDPSSYFSLGAKDRVRRVFEMVDLSSLMDWEAIEAKILQDLENDTDSEKREAFQEAMKAIEEYSNLNDPREILENSLGKLAERSRELKASVKRMQNTLQQNAIDSTGKARAPISKLEKELEEIRAKVSELNVKKAELEKNSGDYVRIAEKLASLKSRFETSEIDIDGDYETEPIDKELEDLSSELYGDTKDPHASRRILEDELNEYLNEQSDYKSKHSFEKSVKDQMLEEFERFKHEIENVTNLDKCPHCHSDHEGWSDTVVNGLKTLRDEMKLKLKAQSEKCYELSVKLNKTVQPIKELEKLRDENDRLISRINELNKKRMFNLSVSTSITEYRMLKGQLPEGFNEDQLKSVSISLQEANDSEKRLLSIISEEKELIENEARLAKMETELMKRQYENRANDEIKKTLERLKEELCEMAFDRILEPANDFCSDLMPSKIEYREGDLGYRNDVGVWVTHRLWCGMESLIGYAAIGMAIASEQKFKLLMMDDLGRLDNQRYELLLQSVERAIQDGLIDQFIGVAQSLPADRICADYQTIEIASE